MGMSRNVGPQSLICTFRAKNILELRILNIWKKWYGTYTVLYLTPPVEPGEPCTQTHSYVCNKHENLHSLHIATYPSGLLCLKPLLFRDFRVLECELILYYSITKTICSTNLQRRSAAFLVCHSNVPEYGFQICRSFESLISIFVYKFLQLCSVQEHYHTCIFSKVYQINFFENV